MSDCKSFESALESYLAGTLDEGAVGPLMAHGQSCPACRELIALHRDLTTIVVPTPDPSDLDAMRSRVLRQVAAGRNAVAPRVPARSEGTQRSPSSWQAWNVTIRPLRWAMGLAAALALFTCGLWTGRFQREPIHLVNGNGAAIEGRLVRAIGVEAASNRALADVEDSRFIYSNVSFRHADEGQVAVDFDVTTHVELVEPLHSPLVEELLAQSLLSQSTTGTRLKAISYAAESMTPKVTEAVLFALRHDESLAVRLQALTMLSDQMANPQVEDAVMATLRDDGAVQMRLLALEYLAEHRVGSDRLRQAIETNARPDDRALMIRLTQYEHL